MKAYLVIKHFVGGGAEGVMFTNKDDAESALHGTESGATLAVEWTDIYGDDPMQMIEIEI